jgi:hypothetical protein
LYHHIAIYYCPTLGVLCANIIKNINDIMVCEHKLRKSVAFSLDMATFRVGISRISLAFIWWIE